MGWRSRRLAILLCGCLPLLIGGAPVLADDDTDPLAAGFANPPNSARPIVWWHWMNGNITEYGIQKDLEWMSRIGIGGLQNFEAAVATPQIVPQRLVYMTPEWKHAFRFAVSTADRLGLEFGIAGSPGWSESGGPWVAPKDGLKKLVWSETIVRGGRPFKGVLPSPPSVTGPYQSLPKPGGIAAMLSGSAPPPPPTYYADSAVVAFPVKEEPPLPHSHVSLDAGAAS